MNTQSAGALLILVGLATLWAVWSDRSPFRVVLGRGTSAAPATTP